MGGLRATLCVMGVVYGVPAIPVQPVLVFCSELLAAGSPVVRVQNLSFGYEAGRGLQLKDVNFTVRSGARCLLTGANGKSFWQSSGCTILLITTTGAGKTTLLRILGGLHMVDSDAVRVLDRPAFKDTSLQSEVCHSAITIGMTNTPWLVRLPTWGIIGLAMLALLATACRCRLISVLVK